eukprot:6138631-Amphidinium_carterae.3
MMLSEMFPCKKLARQYEVSGRLRQSGRVHLGVYSELANELLQEGWLDADELAEEHLTHAERQELLKTVDSTWPAPIGWSVDSSLSDRFDLGRLSARDTTGDKLPQVAVGASHQALERLANSAELPTWLGASHSHGRSGLSSARAACLSKSWGASEMVHLWPSRIAHG